MYIDKKLNFILNFILNFSLFSIDKNTHERIRNNDYIDEIKQKIIIISSLKLS
jgi:hypothetical protein